MTQNPVGPATKEVQFFRRDLTTTAPLTVLGTSAFEGASWGSVVLRELNPTLHRAYGSPLLKAYDIDHAFGLIPAVSAQPAVEYGAPGQSVTDGSMSIVNNQVTYFGLDGESKMMVVSPDGQFQAVSDAVICDEFTSTTHPNCVGPFFPNPFIYASVQSVANWRDPDGVNEWFVAGSPMWRRRDQLCNLAPLIDYCSLTDACGSGPFWWEKHNEPMSPGPEVGWFIVKMKTGNIGGSPPSASTAEMKWWQLYSPFLAGQKTESQEYISSLVDPRTTLVGGIPQPDYIHCVRTGTNRGLRVWRRQDLLASVAQTCSGASPGRGEIINPPPLAYLGTPPLLVCETHVEILTDTEQCLIQVPLGGTPPVYNDNPRNLYNNKSDVFSLTGTNQTVKWIIAVTQGWVASGPSPNQPTACTWDDWYGRAMIGFYDITIPAIEPYPPTSSPMAPIRVGLSNTQGHAWAVKTKTFPSGETFAFVADFAGKLLVFKVSYSDLFASLSPYHPANRLAPVATYRFPGDPSDLMAANCIDLELDGDLLYCALGRAGLGVVDIADPYNPVLKYLIDTPGLVEGLAWRTIDGKDQLVVGDTRCGMRLYGRVGE